MKTLDFLEEGSHGWFEITERVGGEFVGFLEKENGEFELFAHSQADCPFPLPARYLSEILEKMNELNGEMK